MSEINELRKKGKLLESSVRIGQKGLSDSVIEEIKKQLRKKKFIKIKLLNNFIGEIDKKQVVLDLVEKTGSILIDFVGFTLVIGYKKSKK